MVPTNISMTTSDGVGQIRKFFRWNKKDTIKKQLAFARNNVITLHPFVQDKTPRHPLHSEGLQEPRWENQKPRS